MLKITNHVCLLVSVLIITSCYATNEVSQMNSSEGEIGDVYQTLAEYLRHQPGVSVSTRNGQTTVNIRGSFSLGPEDQSSSTFSGTSPLYVIDGVRSGHEYNLIAQIVDIQTVSSINILKGVDASTQYGLDGSNGVIVINTKR